MKITTSDICRIFCTLTHLAAKVAEMEKDRPGHTWISITNNGKFGYAHLYHWDRVSDSDSVELAELKISDTMSWDEAQDQLTRMEWRITDWLFGDEDYRRDMYEEARQGAEDEAHFADLNEDDLREYEGVSK